MEERDIKLFLKGKHMGHGEYCPVIAWLDETPSKEDSGLYTKEDMIGFAEYILNHTSGLPEHNYVGPEKLAKYELTHKIKKV